jgi:hypothetical protein
MWEQLGHPDNGFFSAALGVRARTGIFVCFPPQPRLLLPPPRYPFRLRLLATYVFVCAFELLRTCMSAVRSKPHVPPHYLEMAPASDLGIG